MLLLVGLGNPDPGYEHNRHNVGFMALDEIADRYGFSPARARFQGLAADGRLVGEKVLALKPTTFMNCSGRSVGEAARYFKVPPEDVIVFHDELDLAAGKIRVKLGGGHAGHNGLRSLDQHIGKNYWRVRIGIGHPGDKDKVEGHVLKDFSKAEQKWLEPLLTAIAEAVPLLIDGDAGAFMNTVTTLTRPAPKKGSEPSEKPESGTDGVSTGKNERNDGPRGGTGNGL
jgi:PTH1 family peptidyl-tRNA hydrolase